MPPMAMPTGLAPAGAEAAGGASGSGAELTYQAELTCWHCGHGGHFARSCPVWCEEQGLPLRARVLPCA